MRHDIIGQGDIIEKRTSGLSLLFKYRVTHRADRVTTTIYIISQGQTYFTLRVGEGISEPNLIPKLVIPFKSHVALTMLRAAWLGFESKHSICA